jgi:esterase/lipase superfamily enzyme
MGGPARAGDAEAIPIVRVRASEPIAFESARAGACVAHARTIDESPVEPGRFSAALTGPGIARVVVFVPGFATSVRLASVEALRIQHELGPSDLLVEVDWGSAGRKTAYERDAATARKNAPMLAAALLELKRLAPNRQLDVFAHSLGTRIVAMALPLFKARDGVVLQNVVLAAPDMTIADYRRAIARIPGPFHHITLYVSRTDRALLLSEIVHLHRRLGQVTQPTAKLPNTDVVDASAARHGIEGHGYALQDPLLIDDIGLTLAGARVPHPRWRTRKNLLSQTWQFALPPNEPPLRNPPC